jgi:hypothetical protein
LFRPTNAQTTKNNFYLKSWKEFLELLVCVCVCRGEDNTSSFID